MAIFDVLIYKLISPIKKMGFSFWIEKYLRKLHPRFKKNIFTDGIKLTLNNYYFQHDNPKGTSISEEIAIGTKIVSTILP